MNKFCVFPCTNKEDITGYNGPVVPLVCSSNVGFIVFFPISEENASIINTVLEKKFNKKNINIGSIIGVYRTMVDSWNSGGRFLSGIFLDSVYEPKEKQEVLSVKAVISNEHGHVDSIININFVHAIIIAAMYRYEMILSKELLDKLSPKKDVEDEEDSTKENKQEDKLDKFPVDNEILKIAKKIMNGKIK